MSRVIVVEPPQSTGDGRKRHLHDSDLYGENGFGNAQFHQWRYKFDGMDASPVKRMKELEDENKRLKKMYAEEKLKADVSEEAPQNMSSTRDTR